MPIQIDPRTGHPKKQIVIVDRTDTGQFKKSDKTTYSRWKDKKADLKKLEKKTTKKKSSGKKTTKTKKRTFSQVVKDAKNNQLDRFFGERDMNSNKYFTFKHAKSKDEIIIITSNVKYIKGSPVMIVANNQGVYLKDWQLKTVHNYHEGLNDIYAVKLNRQYYKPYTFRFDFTDILIEKPQTFDDLHRIATKQDRENMPVAVGRMG